MGLISRVSSRTYRKSQKTTKISNMAAEAQQASRPISKKHLFVRDGLFKAELDEFFKRELAEDGYSGVIVRKSKTCEVIIIATRPSQVLGEKTRRIRELTAIVNKRWGHEQGQIDLYVERVANRGLSAVAQAESLRYKLLGGLAVDELPTVFSDLSWNKAHEVVKLLFLVKSEVNELKGWNSLILLSDTSSSDKVFWDSELRS